MCSHMSGIVGSQSGVVIQAWKTLGSWGVGAVHRNSNGPAFMVVAGQSLRTRSSPRYFQLPPLASCPSGMKDA